MVGALALTDQGESSTKMNKMRYYCYLPKLPFWRLFTNIRLEFVYSLSAPSVAEDSAKVISGL